ncbi:hypothetical protein ACHQM5_003139 [Ranunculus cassubicifolius]
MPRDRKESSVERNGKEVRHEDLDSVKRDHKKDLKRNKEYDSEEEDYKKDSKRKKGYDSEEEDYSSEDEEDKKHRRSKKKKRSSKRSSRRRYGDDDSSSSYSEESESESSDYSSHESDSEEERRRRKRRERKRRKEREYEKEKRRKRKEKEKKRKGGKDVKEKKKKKDKSKGAVTNSWGKYGIIREQDMWNKRPEFTAWLLEVKKVNLESLPNWEEKQMFKEFMEDHNTATFPSKKYYNLDSYHRLKVEKQMKKGIKVPQTERTIFNDEEQRRQEMMAVREKQKEEQVEALKRSMQSGMAQAMKEQAQLREEMAYLFKIGKFEAAAAIQRRLDPDVAM